MHGEAGRRTLVPSAAGLHVFNGPGVVRRSINLTPDQTAQAELAAWSKLWRPRTVHFERKCSSDSSWCAGDLTNMLHVVSHCALGKVRGVDRWSIGELRLLSEVAFEDLTCLLKLKQSRLLARGPKPAGRHDTRAWRARCTSLRERQAYRKLVCCTVFLDCSKCYERIPLQIKAISYKGLCAGKWIPFVTVYALYAALRALTRILASDCSWNAPGMWARGGPSARLPD
eukprot:3309935-Amphidinium_carterae.2